MTPPPDVTPTAQRARRWSLREDVLVEDVPAGDGSGDAVLVHSPWGPIRVDRPSPMVREALRRMLLGPIRLQNVPISARTRGAGYPGEPECLRLRATLDRLSCVVVHSLACTDGRAPLLSVIPVSPRAAFRPVPVAVDAVLRLASDAAFRTVGTELVLGSPRSPYEVHLQRPLACGAAAMLDRPANAVRMAAELRSALPLVTDLLSFLSGSGMVVAVHPDET